MGGNTQSTVRHDPSALSSNPDLVPFFENFESFVKLPEGVNKLREMILGLAFQGRVVK